MFDPAGSPEPVSVPVAFPAGPMTGPERALNVPPAPRVTGPEVAQENEVEFFFHFPVIFPVQMSAAPAELLFFNVTLTTPVLPRGFVPVALHSGVDPVVIWGAASTERCGA